MKWIYVKAKAVITKNVLNVRHPKVCKYFRFYKRCKFGEYCDYLHVATPSVEKVALKVDILEKENNNLIEKVAMLETKCFNLEKKVKKNSKLDIKVRALEEKLQDLEAWLAASYSEDDEPAKENEQQEEIKQELKDLINESKRKRELWEKSKNLTTDGYS